MSMSHLYLLIFQDLEWKMSRWNLEMYIFYKIYKVYVKHMWELTFQCSIMLLYFFTESFFVEMQIFI